MAEADDYPLEEIEEEAPLHPGMLALVLTHGCTFLICSVLLIFTVPKFTAIYMDFGTKLPGPTQIVLNLSDFLKRMPHLGVLGVTLLLVGDGVAYRAAARRSRDAGLAWFWLTSLLLFLLPALIIVLVSLPLHDIGVTISG